MTDLYQQAPGSKGYSPQDWEVVRRMAPGAMLLWVVPVELDIEADIAPISGDHCPMCGVVEPHLHVYRWVGEETP